MSAPVDLTAPVSWDAVLAAKAGVQYAQAPRVPILTAQGTGLGMWDQIPPQPAYIANYAPPGLALWQPVGNYPASIFNPPMGVSAQMLADEFVRLLTEVYPTGKFAVEVYSQSAVSWSHVWRDEILARNGKLYGRADDMLFTIALGNPMRCPGVANGNKWAGWPMPGKINGVTTGGIAAADDLKPNEVPANFYDFVNMGSDNGGSALYENCPVGDNPWTAPVAVGAVENSIYKAVMEQSFGSILAIANDLSQPIGVVEGIINGFKFLGAGAAADHYTYPTDGPIALQNWCLANYASSYA